MDKNAPIGIFDSGVGGLTVAREVMRQLPDERIVYFGDTARLPYGTKSQDTVIRFSEQIMRFLRSKGVKAIVIACNTASSYALDALRRSEDIPIIGVINAVMQWPNLIVIPSLPIITAEAAGLPAPRTMRLRSASSR